MLLKKSITKAGNRLRQNFFLFFKGLEVKLVKELGYTSHPGKQILLVYDPMRLFAKRNFEMIDL